MSGPPLFVIRGLIHSGPNLYFERGWIPALTGLFLLKAVLQPEVFSCWSAPGYILFGGIDLAHVPNAPSVGAQCCHPPDHAI
jgi:hypothetical protein